MQQTQPTKRTRHPALVICGREIVSPAPVVPGTAESVEVVVEGGSCDDGDVICAAPLGFCAVQALEGRDELAAGFFFLA